MELKAVDFSGIYFPPGEVIAERFKLAEKIGEGPFGQVFRAEDILIEADVAIKVFDKTLLSNPLHEEQFLKATRRARALTQKNVVRLHDSGVHKDHPWVSMQYLEGLNLRKVVSLRFERRERFKPEELEPILAQITLALQHVARDFAHGDLKPENVIFLPDLLKVTDSYLLSALPGKAFAQRNEKSPFVAPELLNGDFGQEADPRCDVYSVGAIIGFMLFGENYNPGDSRDKPGRLGAMDALCRRAMAFDPMERYRSVESLNEDFTSIIDTGAHLRRDSGIQGKLERPHAPPAPPSSPPSSLNKAAPAPPPAPPGSSKESSPLDVETPMDIGRPPKQEESFDGDDFLLEEISVPESTLEFDRSQHKSDLGNLLPTNEVDRSALPSLEERQSERSKDTVVVSRMPEEDKKKGVVVPTAKGSPPSTINKKRKGSEVLVVISVLAVLVLILFFFFSNGNEDGPGAVERSETAEVVDVPEETLDGESETGEDHTALSNAIDGGKEEVAQAHSSATSASSVRAEELAAQAEAEALREAALAVEQEAAASAQTGQVAQVEDRGGRASEPSGRTQQGSAAAPAPAPAPAATSGPARGTSCPSGMVLVRRGDGNVCIDAYEYPGRGQTPRVRASWFDARRTCENQGKRLCSLSEWRSACGRAFPYGNQFDPDRCNTADEDGFARSLAAAGAFPQCRSASGAYDMSGNVHEWVEEQRVAGGGYDSEADLASCRYSSPKAPGSTDPNVGFRCCVDPE